MAVNKSKSDISASGGEKKNWYADRYEAVSVQRNVFAVIAVLSLGLSIIAIFAVSQLAPLKSVEPFVIQVDQKSGITQVVNPLTAHELTANEAVNQYFIVQYCRARESYLGSMERNYFNYNLVRVLSEVDVFTAYQHEIALSNPDSPGARLGAGGTRDIHIESIKYLDRHKNQQGQENLRYLVKAEVTEQQKAGVPKDMQKLILIEFNYADLELTTEDRYLNPLGFRVVSYRVDDEALSQ